MGRCRVQEFYVNRRINRASGSQSNSHGGGAASGVPAQVIKNVFSNVVLLRHILQMMKRKQPSLEAQIDSEFNKYHYSRSSMAYTYSINYNPTKNSFRYDEITNVWWMINFGYLELLKYKIKRGENLLWTSDAIELLIQTSDDKELLDMAYREKRDLFAKHNHLRGAIAVGNLEFAKRLTTQIDPLPIPFDHNDIMVAMVNGKRQVFDYILEIEIKGEDYIRPLKAAQRISHYIPQPNIQAFGEMLVILLNHIDKTTNQNRLTALSYINGWCIDELLTWVLVTTNQDLLERFRSEYKVGKEKVIDLGERLVDWVTQKFITLTEPDDEEENEDQLNYPFGILSPQLKGVIVSIVEIAFGDKGKNQFKNLIIDSEKKQARFAPLGPFISEWMFIFTLLCGLHQEIFNDFKETLSSIMVTYISKNNPVKMEQDHHDLLQELLPILFEGGVAEICELLNLQLVEMAFTQQTNISNLLSRYSTRLYYFRSLEVLQFVHKQIPDAITSESLRYAIQWENVEVVKGIMKLCPRLEISSNIIRDHLLSKSVRKAKNSPTLNYLNENMAWMDDLNYDDSEKRRLYIYGGDMGYFNYFKSFDKRMKTNYIATCDQELPVLKHYYENFQVDSPTKSDQFFYACKWGSLEIVKYLMEVIYQKSSIEPEYSIDWALVNGHNDIVDYLVQNHQVKYGWVSLGYAASIGDIPLFNSITSNYPKNISDDYGRALSTALRCKQFELARLMLQNSHFSFSTLSDLKMKSNVIIGALTEIIIHNCPHLIREYFSRLSLSDSRNNMIDLTFKAFSKSIFKNWSIFENLDMVPIFKELMAINKHLLSIDPKQFTQVVNYLSLPEIKFILENYQDIFEGTLKMTITKSALKEYWDPQKKQYISNYLDQLDSSSKTKKRKV